MLTALLYNLYTSMSHSHLLANQVIGHACHRTMHMNTSSQVVSTNNAQKKSGDLTLSLLFAHSVAAHHTDRKTGFNALVYNQ